MLGSGKIPVNFREERPELLEARGVLFEEGAHVHVLDALVVLLERGPRLGEDGRLSESPRPHRMMLSVRDPGDGARGCREAVCVELSWAPAPQSRSGIIQGEGCCWNAIMSPGPRGATCTTRCRMGDLPP